MDWIQAITIIASILIPLFGGFAWIVSWLRSIDHRLNDLETRVTVVETRMGFIERLLEMIGTPLKTFGHSNKERTDP